MIFVCSECAVAFEAIRDTAKTCSDACRQRRHERLRTMRERQAVALLQALAASAV